MMKMEELNPFIRYANMHEAYYPQKENSICYDCRFFFVLQGEGTFVANGKIYTVSHGVSIFLPPKTQYSFHFTKPDDVKICVINFDLVDDFNFKAKSLSTATESTFNPEMVLAYDIPEEFSLPIIQQNAIHIRAYISSCIQLFLEKTNYYKHSASANLKLALIELLHEHRSERSDYKLVLDVQEFIHNHYTNAELTNKEIAEQFNYHPYHINRLMKRHAKKTLHDYLIDYRLHIAKSYLRTTALTVTVIAEKTGFPSYTYFIKLFRERIGVSPLQYRKTHKNIGF